MLDRSHKSPGQQVLCRSQRARSVPVAHIPKLGRSESPHGGVWTGEHGAAGTCATYSHRDRCAIVGIGATDFSSDSGRSDLTLATQASLAAIDDAGLRPRDIDGIIRCDHDLVRHNDLAESIGVQNLTYWSTVGPGGVAPCAMVGHAVAAIMSGQATAVLAYRSLNGRSGRR